MLKRWSIFTALLLVFTCSADARFPRGSGTSQTIFTHVQIGGAGLVTGISSVPSANLLLARIDQYGAYKSVSNGNWQQLVTVQAMPAGSVTAANGAPSGNSDNSGVEELVGDMLTTTNLWMGYNGFVYFSPNLGTSWTQTCYPAQTATSNNGNRTMGRKIAVDPANSSIAYMSTPSAAMQRTVNQGSTCAAVTGYTIPTALGSTLVAFDSSQGTTTTCPGSASICTKSIYASSYGTGVYHSTDAGLTWTLTTGTPTTHWYMVVDANGILWFIDNSNGNGLGVARTFNGASWSTALTTFTNSNIVTAVAYDPNHCAASNCHVAFLVGGGGGAGGTTAYTVNSGTSWVSATGVNTSNGVGDPGWTATTINNSGIFPSGAAFDASGNVYTGDEGVIFVVPPTSAVTAQYTTKIAGIEEFLANQVVTSPGTSGALIITGWDVGCFTLAAPYTSFPTNGQHGCASQITFQHAYAVDWAAGTPTTFTSLVDNQQGYGGGVYASYSGPSTDSGATWTHSGFTVPNAISTGGFKAGCLTSGTNPATLMWGPTDGSGGAVAPFYSSNNGGSWTQISVSGVTAGWPYTFANNSHQCAADRVTANTFYFYNWNIGSGPDALIKCTGTTCTNQSTPNLGAGAQFNPTLKAVPGQAGYLFLANGLTGSGATDVSTNGFYYYINDGGVTPHTIAGATNVTAFGFGAAFPGHTFPAIVFSGFYNHVWGIWRSIDWDGAQTWQQIGTYLQDSAGRQYPLSVFDIDGDKSIPGVFYYGTASGVFCGALSTSQCNGGT